MNTNKRHKLTLTEKAHRVVRLVLGMRNPRVAKELARYGFTEAVVEEGWRLLQAAGGFRTSSTGRPPENDDTIAMLDEWENEWFPIVDAVLKRPHPAVHAQLFTQLAQTSGPGVALTVRTLIERVGMMSAGAGGYGPEGIAARQTLEKHGFTDAVMASATLLLDALSKTADLDNVTDDVAEREKEKAVAEMWAWYLQWKQIARIAIVNRALLRQLGLVHAKSTVAGDGSDDETADGGEEEDEDAIDSAPAVDTARGGISPSPMNGAAAGSGAKEVGTNPVR